MTADRLFRRISQGLFPLGGPAQPARCRRQRPRRRAHRGFEALEGRQLMAADHLMLAAKAPALVGTPHAASAATSQAQALAVVGTPFISGAQLTGSYFVHSNGRVATIAQNGTDLILTDELGKSTRAQWVDADQ
ncbi:MAG TPA: hypothetical protein VGX76_02615, partial [Pirellulales bacterium]|nr:hypothetical protein [Pirellulales bacterium]